MGLKLLHCCHLLHLGIQPLAGCPFCSWGALPQHCLLDLRYRRICWSQMQGGGYILNRQGYQRLPYLDKCLACTCGDDCFLSSILHKQADEVPQVFTEYHISTQPRQNTLISHTSTGTPVKEHPATWIDLGLPSGMVICIPIPRSISSGLAIAGLTRVTVAPESIRLAAWQSPMVTGLKCFLLTSLECNPTVAIGCPPAASAVPLAEEVKMPTWVHCWTYWMDAHCSAVSTSATKVTVLAAGVHGP
ncbi:hypothetical protein FKM82_018566 [Ascaphus truei]